MVQESPERIASPSVPFPLKNASHGKKTYAIPRVRHSQMTAPTGEPQNADHWVLNGKPGHPVKGSVPAVKPRTIVTQSDGKFKR